LTTTNEDERSGFSFLFFIAVLLRRCFGLGPRLGPGPEEFHGRCFRSVVGFVFPRLLLLFFKSTALNPAKGVTASTYHHSQHIIIITTTTTVAIPGRYMSLPNIQTPFLRTVGGVTTFNTGPRSLDKGLHGSSTPKVKLPITYLV
jgi:hypothetical protein